MRYMLFKSRNEDRVSMLREFLNLETDTTDTNGSFGEAPMFDSLDDAIAAADYPEIEFSCMESIYGGRLIDSVYSTIVEVEYDVENDEYEFGEIAWTSEYPDEVTFDGRLYRRRPGSTMYHFDIDEWNETH